jgi:hypothetical protein
VDHFHVDRQDLQHRAGEVEEFGAAAVVDTCAMTADDVTAVLPVLPEVPTVVLSSQDVYQAYTGLRTNRCESPVPLTEDSELRRDRYPYRGSGLEGVPEDYEKLDVEEHCRPATADGLRPARPAAPRRPRAPPGSRETTSDAHRRGQPAVDPRPRR